MKRVEFFYFSCYRYKVAIKKNIPGGNKLDSEKVSESQTKRITFLKKDLRFSKKPQHLPFFKWYIFHLEKILIFVSQIKDE